MISTLSDKNSADKSAKNLHAGCCRKFCPAKNFVRLKFCPAKNFVRLEIWSAEILSAEIMSDILIIVSKMLFSLDYQRYFTNANSTIV